MSKTSEPKDVQTVEGVSRSDGFRNLVTGVGTNQDKRIFNEPVWQQRNLEFYEQFYASDELASRIVDCVPEAALRKWIEFTSVDKEAIAPIEEKCKDLGLRESMLHAWIMARTFGGSIVYLVSKTGNPATALQEGEEIIAAVPLSRYDVRIFSSEIEADFASPNYSRPRLYHLNLQMGSNYKGYPIHWSRCIRFDGDPLQRRSYIRNNYWHDSTLNRLFNSIRNYQSANDNAASILQDFNMGVYKMKNLAHLMSSGKEEEVQNRLRILNFSKSVLNALILDSEDEEYVDLSRSVNGLADMLRQQSNRLVAATDIPHTILLGESPDGSNATGNATTEQWHRYIESEQMNYLKPRLDRAFDIIFSKIDNAFEYKFKNLRELNEQEQADLRSKQAQTDAVYIDRGVVDPEEIAESRFGQDEYSTETHLNREMRDIVGTEGEDLLSQAGEEIPDDRRTDEEGPRPDEPFRQGQNYTQNQSPELDQGDDNPLPTVPDHLKDGPVDAKEVQKTEAKISISESTPFRDPLVNDISYLKNVPGQTIVAPLGDESPRDRDMKAINPYERNDAEDEGRRVVTLEVILDGKMLMGQRLDNQKWTHPGGHVDQGESPLEAAVRELREETGIIADAGELEFVQAKRIKTKRNRMDVYHFRLEKNNEALATTGTRDPDAECYHWRFVDDRFVESKLDSLHAPQNIILQSRGMIRKDSGESLFMPRQLNATKDKSKDVKYADDGRCWEGFEPVPGKEPFSEGSCRKADDDHQDAEYEGRKVKLRKPFRLPDGSSKKFGVYVKDGDKVIKVTFGSPDMEIKRDDPKAREAFRNRMGCDAEKDETSANYWSCQMWEAGTTVSEMMDVEA